jgi:hypothetical protein
MAHERRVVLLGYTDAKISAFARCGRAGSQEEEVIEINAPSPTA